MSLLHFSNWLLLLLCGFAAADALFPPKGEKEKSQIEREQHHQTA